MESDLSDAGKASSVSEEEEEEEGEKATPRRSRPRRSSIGLRVAFQFPTKKLAKKSDDHSSEPLFSSTCLQDSKKAILGRKRSCRQGKEREDSVSESEDDSRGEGQEGSDALLKRTMNIKENKAMVSPGGGRSGRWHWAPRLPGLPQSCCCSRFGRERAPGSGCPFSVPEPQPVIT